MINDRLKADHDELDKLFEEVFSFIATGDCSAVYQKLDLFWARLAMHIRAEHRYLFPMIRALVAEPADPLSTEAAADLSAILLELRQDHDHFMTQLARAIKALRLTFYFGNEIETLEIVRDILTEVRDRLTIHNRTEETRIYGLATNAFLPAEQIEKIKTGIDTELNRYPHRFSNAGSAP